ncbi:MAG: DUF1523 family protein [Maricaulaceae bacterium]
MKWIKNILLLVFVLFAGISMYYYLPSHDIVQIVGTDVKRMDIDKKKSWFWDKPDAGTKDNITRDVRFINSTKPNGKPRVYRNEDTNWSFPPYFKFDSGDLNSQAQDLAKRDDVWVAVKHYGWRIKLFSVFPNAVKIKKVDGPHVRIIPWFNIVFILVLILIVWRVMRFFGRLKKKHVDPVTDKVENAAEAAGESVAKKKRRAKRLFISVFGTTRRNK